MKETEKKIGSETNEKQQSLTEENTNQEKKIGRGKKRKLSILYREHSNE